MPFLDLFDFFHGSRWEIHRRTSCNPADYNETKTPKKRRVLPVQHYLVLCLLLSVFPFFRLRLFLLLLCFFVCLFFVVCLSVFCFCSSFSFFTKTYHVYTTHHSCEMEDFVEIHPCKLCVILLIIMLLIHTRYYYSISISRVTGCVCPHRGHGIGRRLPLMLLIASTE